MERQNKQIILTNEEIDRLLEILGYVGSDDAQELARKIYLQQMHNPSDVPQLLYPLPKDFKDREKIKVNI